MNYGPSHAHHRYAPAALPNYAALAATHRGLVGAAGDPTPPPPAPAAMTTWESFKATMEKPNATVFDIPNKYLLGGVVALGVIGTAWHSGALDKIGGGSRRR